MLWGYGKYSMYTSLACMMHTLPWLSGYHNLADGRFATAKILVPQCLDACELTTIRKFFQKSWRYLDAYKQGLDAKEAALANKKYKSHRKISLPSDIIDEIDTSDT